MWPPVRRGKGTRTNRGGSAGIVERIRGVIPRSEVSLLGPSAPSARDRPDDAVVRLAVVADDPSDRASALGIARQAGCEVTVSRLLDPAGLVPGADGCDAVLFLPRGAALEPGVVVARLRSTAAYRAVVLGLPGGAPLPPTLAPSLGPGAAILRWPATADELARSVLGAVGSARAARRLDEAGAPPETAGRLEIALTLAGPEGHPLWFIEALVGALDLADGGGAVLLPRRPGAPRILALSGLTEAQVLRVLRRQPPERRRERAAAHVRLLRAIRSSSARLRGLRGWWWLPGPSCAEPGSVAVLVHGRFREEPAWLDRAVEVVADRLSHRAAVRSTDPVTGLELGDAAVVAAHAEACASGAGAGGGACVLAVAIDGLPPVRRDRGPRAEGRVVAAVARLLAARCRPGDLLVRADSALFAVIVPAPSAEDADRIRARFDGALRGRTVLGRGSDDARGGIPLDAVVRAAFIAATDSRPHAIEILRGIGVPGGDVEE